MPKLKQSILTIVIGLALAAGISYASHGQWHGATANPPLDNAPAPINVSALSQIKGGAFQVNGFRNIGGSIFDGNSIFNGSIKIPTGAGPGKVLTSDASGNASWQDLDLTTPPSKITEVRNKQFLASGAFKVPSGVNKVWVELQGGGGGGGGGYVRYDRMNVYAPGGGGGGGASVSLREFSVSSEASIPVTVGAGGAGGDSVKFSSKGALVTNGQNGQAGGGSSFGSFVSVAGGAGGKIAVLYGKYYLTAGLGGEIGGAQGKCNDGMGSWTSNPCKGFYIAQSGADFMDHYGGKGGGTGGMGAQTTSQVFCSQGEGMTICQIELVSVFPAGAGSFPGGGGGGGVVASSVYDRQTGKITSFVDKGANGAGGFVTVLWCDAGLVPVDGEITSGLCQQP